MSRFRRHLAAAASAAATLTALSALLSAAPAAAAAAGIFDPAAAAAAGIFDGVCEGKPAAHIIKSYPVKDGTQAPLRCGTARYGYIHIRDRHGFLADTDGKIAYAVKNHQSIKEDSPTATTYFSGPRQSGYRTVVERKTFSDGRGQGIITAY